MCRAKPACHTHAQSLGDRANEDSPQEVPSSRFDSLDEVQCRRDAEEDNEEDAGPLGDIVVESCLFNLTSA